MSTGEVAVGLMSRRGITGRARQGGDNGPMDTTPEDDPISELAAMDPADAVEAAEQLADELEAQLAPDAEDGGDGAPTPA